MRLETEFIRLPLVFDASRLAEEIGQFGEGDWRPHPQGYPGNTALSLVSIGGDPKNDETRGAMGPTPYLDRCPYLRQVLASLEAPIGRTRLMRIDGNGEATAHIDTNYYWLGRARVHVPIVTDPAVMFLSGERSIHMKAGETWIFNTWQVHNVINPRPTRRIHLVADTAGAPGFWSLVDKGERPFDSQREGDPPRLIEFDPESTGRFALEEHNFPVVMAPEEQESLMAFFNSCLPATSSEVTLLSAEVKRFLDSWRELWSRHGAASTGWPAYRELLDGFDRTLGPLEKKVMLTNGADSTEVLRQMFIRAALNPQLAENAPAAASTRPAGRRRIERPIFIVSSPRSGSSLLFETLAQSPTVWTIGGESHALIEGVEKLQPRTRGFESNRLTEIDADEETSRSIALRFLTNLRDRKGDTRLPGGSLRLLEKTPKNSLRVPFLRAIFPDALFVYLYRDPRATMSSMIDAWRSGKFVTYPDLPGWAGPPWSLLLTPGWRDLNGRVLAEIVAHQWKETTNILLDDLESLPADSWCIASYERLVNDPQKEIERLCGFVDIGWDRQLTAPLPNSRHTLTPPDADKWKRNGDEIDKVVSITNETAERARNIFGMAPKTRMRVHTPKVETQAPPPAAAAGATLDLRSIHTASFPDVLQKLGVSILVSTYQTGRIVVLREKAGVLNTHFRSFPSPMGMAVGRKSLALATLRQVWRYFNQPEVGARIEPPGQHDACYVPRHMHVTGDIRIHEVAFDSDDELWVVNTRFSTLCTLDEDHSFIPRWRPPFISHLAPEDRCHLNGVSIIDGRPRFATALGETNQKEGWRDKKASGGILIDIASNEIVSRGLSMPHSPRWYAGRMWVLESARGNLSTLDLASGKREVVAELPGFTRGLAFAGPYAFVGLSQVRESVFEGIPLSERLALNERACGVWIVDIRTGQIAGFLKFEETVQEIFDVQILHGVRYPELVEPDSVLVGGAFALPPDALAEVAR